MLASVKTLCSTREIPACGIPNERERINKGKGNCTKHIVEQNKVFVCKKPENEALFPYKPLSSLLVDSGCMVIGPCTANLTECFDMVLQVLG